MDMDTWKLMIWIWIYMEANDLHCLVYKVTNVMFFFVKEIEMSRSFQRKRKTFLFWAFIILRIIQ